MKNRLNILVVDDSKHIRSALQVLLCEEQNIEKLIMANSMEMATDILNSQEIDVAILDISLPDGNGLDLLKSIKANKPEIKVIMMSNNSNAYYREYAKQEKADLFFDKSMEFDDALIELSKMVK